MSVLVTGGSGFIGKYVCENFRKNHIQVYNVDIKDGVDLFKLHETWFPPTFDKIDALVHMAANLEILNVDPLKEMDLNIKGTVKMLEYARKMDISKFVFISSADCYGEPRVYPDDIYGYNKPIVPSKETDELKPFWSYASSKIAGEVYTKQYEELYGIKTVIIRPSIVTGYGEWYGRLVTLQMSRIRQNKPMLIFGNGEQTRDFVAVQDVAKIICQATIKDVETPAIYNAGTGVTTTVNKMVTKLHICAGLKGYKSTSKYIDPPVGELGRKQHEQINQCLDMSKTSADLGVAPNEYGLNQAISEEMDWVLSMSEPEFKKWMEKPRY